MRKAKHPPVFWLFLAPVLFAFVVVIVVPFLLGVFYSFTNWSATARLGETLSFIGLENYGKILKDPSFLYSFMLTVVYTVLNMAAINVVSNYAAGRADCRDGISFESIQGVLHESMDPVRALIEKVAGCDPICS